MFLLRNFAVGLLMLATCGTALAAAPLPAFTAHYRVLRNGSPIGDATLTLARGNAGGWVFTTASRGTAGLAAVLGAGTLEVSSFHWVGNLPQGDSYKYTLKAFKTKHRSVRFDWASRSIEVDDHGLHRFPAVSGALERHTVPLALAASLAAGETAINLPVAVKDRIQTQQYLVQGKQNIRVPAGSFNATRVRRVDGDGEAFEGWFAPAQLPVPVQIDQRGKDDLQLQLESWSPQG